MAAKIKNIDYYLPENVLTNEDLSNDFPEWTVEKITGKIGINKRHISGIEECSSDLAVRAAEKLFGKEGISTEIVDYLILCTQSPDYFLPTTACLVQNRLGLRKDIGALDINLGCSGYIYGLGMAKGLIDSKQARNVLLITSETYSKHIHNSDKGNRAIFGDAATATLVVEDPDGWLDYFVYGTDGSGANNLIVRNGGLRNNKSNSNSFNQDDFLFMNGMEIFSFTLEKVPVVVSQVLEKSKLTLNDVDLFIFHQANKYMLENLRKKLRIDENKFYYYISEVGNTVSSTIPLALNDAIQNNKIKKNDKVMLVGFGVGYSWGGCLVQF